MSEAIKILIVDDNEDDRLVYRRTLQKLTDRNYSTIETEDGEEGLKRIAQEQPACVLLDYSLPRHNGIRILGNIRSLYPFIPVIMLTGQGNEKVAVEAMQKGAQNYIAKSNITPEILDHVIRLAIENCMLQKRIHEQHESLEVFTHALAHDLREPVRTIRSFAELILQSNTFSGKTAGHFQHIRSAADRMHMLIETVFLYTRLEDPRQMDREICGASIVVQEALENMNQLIQERSAAIHSDALPEIYANRTQILQIFQNLISNAIHHNNKDITVDIEAQDSKNYWLFSVKDNGIGIERANFQKIFEPFKRLQQHEEEEGAGLGLAICKKIVESHGGKIWCDSEPGTGATFLFTLPKAIPEGSKIALPVATATSLVVDNTRSSGAGSRLANMLMVDDGRADIEIAQFRLIERPGLQCNFLTAHNGEEALELLRERMRTNLPIDLMLIDINMPEMDGFELLEHMVADETLRKIPAIMCTGSTYDKDMQRAKALGALGYITKPVDFDRLKSIIDTIGTVRLQEEERGYKLMRAA